MTRSPSTKSPSPSSDATPTMDMLRNPFSKLEESLEKKKRNLLKRLQRLQSYQEEQIAGKKLTPDQLEALSKIAEVEMNIELNKELKNTVSEQMKEFAKVLKESDLEKERQEKEKEKSKDKPKDKKEKKGKEPKEPKESKEPKEDKSEKKSPDLPAVDAVPSTGDETKTIIRQVLLHRELLEQLSRPIVRKAFVNGDFGAPKLAESELQLLEDLHTTYNPVSDGCKLLEDFEKRLTESADAVAAIVNGQEKIEEVERRRAVMHTVASCAYFEQMKQNAASRKEKKDKNKEAKKEREAKEKEEKKEKEQQQPEEEQEQQLPPPPPAHPKTPIVTFIDHPRNVVYIGMEGNMEVESFLYDDSLPHPDHVVQATTTETAENGSDKGSGKASPPAAPKPSPSESKEGSGAATPIETRTSEAMEMHRRHMISNLNSLANPTPLVTSTPPGYSIPPFVNNSFINNYPAAFGQPQFRPYNINGAANGLNAAAAGYYNRRPLPQNGRAPYPANGTNGAPLNGTNTIRA